MAELADAADSKCARNAGNIASSGNHSVASDEQNRPDALTGAKWGDGADAVEIALADAITKAATAGAFDVLPRLVAELEARRKARSKTVDLDAERAKRGQR